MTASPDTGTGRDTRAHVAAGHRSTTSTTTRGDLMNRNTPTAGGILAAAGALQDPTRQTFTRAEVAYLMRLAYDSGRTATVLEDIAQTVCCWEDKPFLRKAYEQRVADELADMDRAARARAEREGRPYRPYPGGGMAVDWETGRPVRHLEVAA